MSKFKNYPTTFWVANLIEVFERMAYYGFFTLSSLYITGKVVDGCLGFTSEQRGFIQGVGTFILYLLPVFTGALVERYGHKKILVSAFLLLIPSYYLLGEVSSFWGFFLIFLLVACGAALFKPAITGTIARTTDETNASYGWGIFYMVVNIGGFFGPLVAGILRGWSWKLIFSASAGWIAVNLILVSLFYKEPPSPRTESSEKHTLRHVLRGMVEVIGNGRLFLLVSMLIIIILTMSKDWITTSSALIIMAIWLAINLIVDIPLRKLQQTKTPTCWILEPMKLGHWQFTLFLVLLSGFWVIYNQIFMTGPEYLRDFCDTAPILISLASVFGFIGLSGISSHLTELAHSGYQINPEYILNINSFVIVAFQLFVTWAFLKRKPFITMMSGIIMAGFGMLLLGLGSIKVVAAGGSITDIPPAVLANGWIFVIGCAIFTLGEMITAPKSQEYIASIAPKDKVAIFMGYYFVAVALGNLFGGLLSGSMYGWLARDLKRPDLLWFFFAALAVVTLIAFMIYNRFVIRSKR